MSSDNPLLLRGRKTEVGRGRPVDSAIANRVHGTTSKEFEQQEKGKEERYAKSRRPPPSYIGYKAPPTAQLGSRPNNVNGNPLLAKPSVGHRTFKDRKMEKLVHGVTSKKSSSVSDCMVDPGNPQLMTRAEFREMQHRNLMSRSGLSRTKRKNNLSSRGSLQQSPQKHSQGKQQVDYMEMNKRGVGKGLVQAREQATMRRAGEVVHQRSQKARSAPVRTRSTPSSVNIREMRHGMKSEFNESVGDLMSTRFADEWRASRQMEQDTFTQVKKANSRKGYAMTRTAILRQKGASLSDQPMWQMSRFKNKQSVVGSFRSSSARDRAMDYHTVHNSDKTGINNQGVPKYLLGKN